MYQWCLSLTLPPTLRPSEAPHWLHSALWVSRMQSAPPAEANTPSGFILPHLLSPASAAQVQPELLQRASGATAPSLPMGLGWLCGLGPSLASLSQQWESRNWCQPCGFQVSVSQGSKIALRSNIHCI